MKKVKVLVEFRDAETGVVHKPDDVMEVSEERLAAIRTVHNNLVQVLGEVEKAVPEKVEEHVDEVAPVQPKRAKKAAVEGE